MHFTPANLASSFHRTLEADTTARALSTVFADRDHFTHHPALPLASQLGDEGAANHTRLCAEYGAPGVELFVYGRDPFDPGSRAPARFPARQTLAASEAVARLHAVAPERCIFAQQNPDAIDAGVFHNDVIAVGNLDVLFFHEQAFLQPHATLHALRTAMDPVPLQAIMVPAAQVTLADAVSTYLFNSQLLDRGDGKMVLLAPQECMAHPRVSDYLSQLLAQGGPIAEVLSFDLRQSMHNGGGPACLRLRVVLDPAAKAAVLPSVWLTEALQRTLGSWIEQHYRDQLLPADLADPLLQDECRRALDELTRILRLGSLYRFQRDPGTAT